MNDCGDEPDYMSDDFLVKPCNDIRPGLIHNRAKKRELEVSKKREDAATAAKKNASVSSIAQDRLQAGLAQPIGPENKGFSMLQKMGFKPGTSLGSSQSGIKEPIGINLKSDRKGLGRDAVLRDIKNKKQELRSSKVNAKSHFSVEDYRAELSKKYRERDIASDLFKSQKACYKLDKDALFDSPGESWFWPEQLLPEGDDGSDSPEEDDVDTELQFTVSEKLEMLTLYLRQNYWYCIWCGVEYADEKDLSNECPGPTRDDH